MKLTHSKSIADAVNLRLKEGFENGRSSYLFIQPSTTGGREEQA